jgi:hypothetical protein
MAVKTDFGILYYEDRRPPYRKQKAVIQRPLVCSSGCWDLGVNAAGDALGGSSRRRLCENVLRYLIAITRELYTPMINLVTYWPFYFLEIREGHSRTAEHRLYVVAFI